MMNVNAAYAEKCVTPDEAVTLITPGSHLSMGMFAAEPPALLNALANRVKRGGNQRSAGLLLRNSQNCRGHHFPL